MKYLLNASEMKCTESYTINEIGMLSLVLMEKAAECVAKYIAENYDENSRICILCSSGNNGGDGLAVARILDNSGYSVSIYYAGDETKATEENKYQLNICRKLGLDFASDMKDLAEADVYVDGLFGIGLSRDIEGKYRELIEFINSLHKDVIAIDLPSGICADDGRIMGCAIEAVATITFGYAKIGNVIFPGRKYCGKVVLADIGFDDRGLIQAGPKHLMLEQEDLKYLPEAKVDGHKGSNGRVLCIAGSPEYAGAAILCTKAAMVAGAGMTYLYTHEAIKPCVVDAFPETIIKTYTDFNPHDLDGLMSQVNSIVMGPGLGTDETAVKIVEYVLQNATVPVVVDADAINILALHTSLSLADFHGDIIITPHVGEMSRLVNRDTKDVVDNMLQIAESYASENGITVVLKNASTVIAMPTGETYVNPSGNQGMSVAGSGDVLAGIIGSLMAQGVNKDLCAPMGVYLHGLSGDAMAQKLGFHGLLAGDLLDGIIKVYKELHL
ncbi:MAG: NAD(P)H-hydrate dehydratase [Lachnospiraceae bacterium]|nr:NAD(P)H-hydrate dehydratase [Lachnospiraceae bacterium]